MNGLVHLQPYQNQNVLKSGGYLPSSIIYRNYIVSKQDFETIKQITHLESVRLKFSEETRASQAQVLIANMENKKKEEPTV